jgi:Raf kinase inhibitor-like YbhB/YbcL family protein
MTPPPMDASRPNTATPSTPMTSDVDAGTGVRDAAPAGPGPAAPAGPLRVESDVWKQGEQLDARFRCPGPSPELRFAGAPSTTASYAVVVIDRSNSFVHWLIHDIPADFSGLPEGVPEGGMLEQPPGAKQGAAYNGTRGYVGPCGRNNNPYELTLYALDTAALELGANESGTAIMSEIEAHALESVAVTAMSGPNG